MINVHGKPRVLFSVTDPPNGEMKLSRKYPDVIRPHGAPPDPNARRFLEQYFSIHPSNESAYANNLLKATTVVEGGEKNEYCHLTKVIKSKRNFAFLYVQRLPKLDAHTFDLTKKEAPAKIDLGSYDPAHFTLYLGVMFAARDTLFSAPPPPHINVAQHAFNTVRLIVFWSFLSLPSHPSSMTYHLLTLPETPELIEGMTEQQCFDLFTYQCCVTENELRFFTYMEGGGDPTKRVLFPIQRYFADGMTFTPAAADHMRLLLSKTIDVPRLGMRRPAVTTG